MVSPRLRVRLPQRSLYREPLERETRQDRHRDEHEEHEIRQVREKLDPRRNRDGKEEEPEDREAPGLQGPKPGALEARSIRPGPTPGSRR